MLRAWGTTEVPLTVVLQDIKDPSMPIWYRDLLLGFVSLGPGATMLDADGKSQITELAVVLVSGAEYPTELRRRALFALSQLNPPQAKTLAQQIVAHSDEEMAKTAALVLVAMNGPRHPPPRNLPQAVPRH